MALRTSVFKNRGQRMAWPRRRNDLCFQEARVEDDPEDVLTSVSKGREWWWTWGNTDLRLQEAREEGRGWPRGRTDLCFQRTRLKMAHPFIRGEVEDSRKGVLTSVSKKQGKRMTQRMYRPSFPKDEVYNVPEDILTSASKGRARGWPRGTIDLRFQEARE